MFYSKKFWAEGIKDKRLTAITSDDGSNMRKAFDKLLPDLLSNEYQDDNFWEVYELTNEYLNKSLVTLIDKYAEPKLDVIGLEVSKRIGA